LQGELRKKRKEFQEELAVLESIEEDWGFLMIKLIEKLG
jgi:hypothetical protein